MTKFLSRFFFQPAKIFLGPLDNRQRDDLGDRIAMKFLHPLHKIGEEGPPRLYDHQDFLFVLRLSPPPVNGSDAPDDVYACRELFAHDVLCDFRRLLFLLRRDQHNDKFRHQLTCNFPFFIRMSTLPSLRTRRTVGRKNTKSWCSGVFTFPPKELLSPSAIWIVPMIFSD